MTTLRQAHKNQYVVISNSLAQNNDLSLRARGLMAYLLSLPDNWQIHLNQLAKVMKEGKSILKDILRELKNAGYIHHHKMGFKEGWQYFVFEISTTNEEFKLFLRTDPIYDQFEFPNSSETDPLLSTNKSNTKKELNILVATQPKKISFNFKLNKFTGISEDQISKWKKAFPKIDIIKELIKAKVWVTENPTRNKKRKNWNSFFEEQWFLRAVEKANSKTNVNTHPEVNKAVYDKIKPVYDRYKAWIDRITDTFYLDKGFLVLETNCFYDKKDDEFRYNLNYEKFIEIMEKKYKVPAHIIKG